MKTIDDNRLLNSDAIDAIRDAGERYANRIEERAWVIAENAGSKAINTKGCEHMTLLTSEHVRQAELEVEQESQCESMAQYGRCNA